MASAFWNCLATRAFAGSGRFANFLRAAMASKFDLDLDSLFEFGLVRLLDGLAVFLESRPGTNEAESTL